MGNLFCCGSSRLTPKPASENPLKVTVVGAGETEANGVYVEASVSYSGKPQFVKRIEGTDNGQSAGMALIWYN